MSRGRFMSRLPKAFFGLSLLFIVRPILGQQSCGGAPNQSCSAYPSGPGKLSEMQVATYAKKGIEKDTGKVAECSDLVNLIAIAAAESGLFANCKCENLDSQGQTTSADWGLWQFNDQYKRMYAPWDYYF